MVLIDTGSGYEREDGLAISHSSKCADWQARRRRSDNQAAVRLGFVGALAVKFLHP